MGEDVADIGHASVVMVVAVVMPVFVVMMVFMLMVVRMFMAILMMMVLMIVVVLVRMLMLVVMVMVFAAERDVLGGLLLPVHCHLHMGAGDAAGLGGLPLDLHPGNPETVHLFNERVRVHQFRQGRHQHIPRRAHLTFQIKCFHFASPP